MLKRELNIEAKLVEGDRGEFSVVVNNQIVAKKGWVLFPKETTVLTAVREALG